MYGVGGQLAGQRASLKGAGGLSDCLAHAGKDVIAKSNGGLMRTDLSRTSFDSPQAIEQHRPSSGGITALRAELEEKTRALKALQRNYDSLASVGAGDREELAALRKIREGSESELHVLQKDNDRLSKELALARDAQAAAVAAKEAAVAAITPFALHALTTATYAFLTHTHCPLVHYEHRCHYCRPCCCCCDCDR